MALVQCPECGKTISDSIKSCIHCGVELTKCPECGMVIKATEKACPICGKSMEGEKERMTGLKETSSSKFFSQPMEDLSKKYHTSKGFIDATFNDWKKKNNLPDVLFGMLIPGILIGLGMFFLLMMMVEFVKYTKTVPASPNELKLIEELARLPKGISSLSTYLGLAIAAFVLMSMFSRFRVLLVGIFFSSSLANRQKQDSNYLYTFGKNLRDYVNKPTYQKDNDTIQALTLAHYFEKNSEKKLYSMIALFMFAVVESVATIFASVYCFEFLKYMIQFLIGRGLTKEYKFEIGESSLIALIIVGAISWMITLCRRYFIINNVNQCLQSIK